MKKICIEINNVVKHFPVKKGLFLGKTIGFVKAVDDVSFSITEGETFALVGESGCGKTTLANLILLTLNPNSGDIVFKGKSVAKMSETEKLFYRRSIQAVFQDPYGALNPRMQVGQIIGEPLQIQKFPKDEQNRRIKEAIRGVGLPEGCESQFPHEFSGGQRQRIGLARSLTVKPQLIVLDEPVSNLDISIRSQVLNLLKDIQVENGISYLLISHDMATVEHMSSSIGVMYIGKLVEVGRAEEVTSDPHHPYTATLVKSATPISRQPPWEIEIIGEVPDTLDTPRGCSFHTRCPYSMSLCTQVSPDLVEVKPGRWVSCHLYPHRILDIYKGPRSKK